MLEISEKGPRVRMNRCPLPAASAGTHAQEVHGLSSCHLRCCGWHCVIVRSAGSEPTAQTNLVPPASMAPNTLASSVENRP